MLRALLATSFTMKILGVWIPAFAGTTIESSRPGSAAVHLDAIKLSLASLARTEREMSWNAAIF
jgi:hypothetical protein